MGWLYWLIVGWLGISAVLGVTRIGDVRTRSDIAWSTLEIAVMIAVISIWWPR